MTPRPSSTAIGLGIGLAAAGAATAAGIAADRLTKNRRKALSALNPTEPYDHTPDKELVVVADDGVPLHVEIDEPDVDTSNPDHPTVVFSHGYTLSLKSCCSAGRWCRPATGSCCGTSAATASPSRHPASPARSTSSGATCTGSSPRPFPKGVSSWSATPWAA